MEPPPVQYVTTSDGYKIAYRDAGKGRPFVLTPFPFNNLDRMWRQQTNASLYQALLERYRLIHYDSRGQGMSSRNLDADHAYDDYSLDLGAVIEQLKLDRLILMAGLLTGHTAIRYAAAHPRRVEALILIAMSIDGAIARLSNFEELAMRSWDTALMAFIGGNVRVGDRAGDAASVEYFRDTLLQNDFVAMARSARRSNIEATLREVQCPTLVVSGPMNGALDVDARAIAAGIPGARLVLLDTGRWMSDLYTLDGSPPPIVPVIDEFLRTLGNHGAEETIPSHGIASLSPLSPRESEVLRLIARGRTNQQIADELVLSVRTVERHITNLYAKLGAHGKADATAYALRNNLA
jgi:DNA-binding CsgD family transcriptional regulator/pimeloyl-ACP methyl ester carboxylesterase